MKKKSFLLLTFGILTLLVSGCKTSTEKSKLADSADTLNFTDVTLTTLSENSKLSSMRPVTASADGTVIYVGYIKSGHMEDRGVAAVDPKDGTQKWIYNPGYESYTKGIATDDRGNVYVGIAHAPSENTVSVDIVNSEGKKISTFDITETGEFGVNGLSVYKNGEQYILYIVTNYGPNRIYAFNVTNVDNPVAETSFGTNGMVNLKTLTGNDACEGNYLKADSNGDIYLTANLGNGNKGDCILKIYSNGTKVQKVIDCTEAYGIDVGAGYIFVSTYEGATSHVCAFRQSDYSQVMSLNALPDSDNYAGIAFANGKLYVSDQGYKGGSRLLVSSSLTDAK